MQSFPSDALELIMAHHTLAIATYSDERLHPQIASIYYVFVDNEIYIVARPTTSKIKNIISNGKFAVVITDESSSKTLQIEGMAEIIVDRERMDKVVTEYIRLTDVLSQIYPSVIETPGDKLIVIHLTPTWFQFTNYAEKIVEEKL